MSLSGSGYQMLFNRGSQTKIPWTDHMRFRFLYLKQYSHFITHWNYPMGISAFCLLWGHHFHCNSMVLEPDNFKVQNAIKTF